MSGYDVTQVRPNGNVANNSYHRYSHMNQEYYNKYGEKVNFTLIISSFYVGDIS